MKSGLLSQLALCIIFLSSFSLPAQVEFLRAGVNGAIPIDKLEAMNDALQIADSAQRSDLLKRLGIEANIAEAAIIPRGWNDIKVQPLRTNSGEEYGIISLPCGIRNQIFIYLLDRAGSNTWHVVDHIALDCFNVTPTYGLLSLSPDKDLIFVQHANSGHGTGLVQEKAALFSARHGRMREVFSTTDYIWSQESTQSVPPLEQSSSFLQISRQLIEETRVSLQNGEPVRAQRRTWRWHPEREVFSVTPFRAVRQ